MPVMSRPWWYVQQDTGAVTQLPPYRPPTTPTNQPSITIPTNQPTETKPVNQPTTPTTEPTESSPANQPTESTLINHPTPPTNQPTEVTPANQPTESTPTNQPTTSTNQPIESTPTNYPTPLTNQPTVATSSNQPSTPTNQTIESTPTNQPTKSTATNQPTESTATNHTSTTTNQPTKHTQTNQPTESKPTNHPTTTTNQPYGSTPTYQPTESKPINHPITPTKQLTTQTSQRFITLPEHEIPSTMETPWYQYCRAVLEDGHSIMSFVTMNLYQGGNLRPDMYIIDMHGKTKYLSKFTKSQQETIEKYPNRDHFSIYKASTNYDLPLHYFLHETACGLARSGSSQWMKKGTLENLLNQVYSKWTTITKRHLKMMNEQESIQRIKELEYIYLSILKCVENLSGENLDKVKVFIKNSLHDKHKFHGTNYKTFGHPQSHNISGLGLAVTGLGTGAAVGAGVAGIGHALFGKEDEEGGSLGKSMTTGAAVGAVVGGVFIGLATMAKPNRN